jgi:phage terminase Nu1 subunit (DNA packaging protein)
MIITEELTINGTEFIKTYSDKGMMVERDGVRYSEAIDPARFIRIYTETDEPIEDEPTEPETDEATEADYQEALREMGVEV